MFLVRPLLVTSMIYLFYFMSDDLNIAGSTTSMRTNQNQDILQRGIVEGGPALSRWVVMIS